MPERTATNAASYTTWGDTIVSRLAKDMKARGFVHDPKNPVTVAKMPNGRYAIVDGHHRAAAAVRAGIDKITVVEQKVSPQTAARYMDEVANALSGN